MREPFLRRMIAAALIVVGCGAVSSTLPAQAKSTVVHHAAVSTVVSRTEVMHILASPDDWIW